MAKREDIAFILLIGLLLSPLVSAEAWFISQPKSVYSIGDTLKVTLGLSNVGEQIQAELNCVNQTRLMFFQYISNKTTVEIEQILSNLFLEDMKGDCEIWIKYGNFEEKSQNFLISDNIFLNVETKDQYFEPGNDIEIKGRAEKANKQLLDGFYEIEFPELNFSRTGNVENGNFQVNFSLQENMMAGDYIMNITVYEKNEGEVMNKGEARMTIKIKQVPTKVDVALETQNVHPGENLSFKIMLYDQSGNIIEGEASYLIENSEGKAFEKSLEGINNGIIFYPEKNLTSGYYKIKAYSSGISGERQFYVEENKEVEFRIINGTLAIRNIGNMFYDKAISVSIGDIVEIINDGFALGEEKRYEMIAPQGTYDVKITDGKSLLESQNLALATGRAVLVRETDKSFFQRSKVVAWVFLIFVLGMFIFVTSKRTIKKKFVLTDRLFGKRAGKGKKGGIIKASQIEQPVVKKEVQVAEHSLVLNGKKYDTAIICLKIKNPISPNTSLNLESMLKKLYDKNVTLYRSGEYIMPVFSPLLTSTFKNHVPAVKAALNLQKRLEEHNRKFKDKIDFGISVHNGELVSQVHENKLKFTGLGNTIPTAKRIADVSEKEVLLSRQIHERTMAEIKAEPLRRNGMEIFTVKSVVDRDKNKLYISEFLKRLDEK